MNPNLMFPVGSSIKSSSPRGN